VMRVRLQVRHMWEAVRYDDLIYFVYIACFRPADHRVEGEPVENF
jgi:hypothetical protein